MAQRNLRPEPVHQEVTRTMPSASKRTDAIRKRKDKPHKTNRKTDQKRTMKNRELLKALAAGAKS
jgi:hypothetical protein